eukprot:222856-Rhodomonas_salina.1
MPSFVSGGARAGYAVSRVVSRAGRTADLLLLAPLPWLSAAATRLLSPPGVEGGEGGGVVGVGEVRG